MRADIAPPQLSQNGEFVGNYTVGCPWGNPYCLWGIFSGAGWRCVNKNKHVPITADDIVRAGWDEYYWTDRECVTAVKWNFVLEKEALRTNPCPEKSLGVVWKGLVPPGLVTGRSKRRVMNDSRKNEPDSHDMDPYAC